MNERVKMSREEFIAQCARDSKLSKGDFDKLGFLAVPCECDYGGCEGWKMIQTTHDFFNLDHLEEPYKSEAQAILERQKPQLETVFKDALWDKAIGGSDGKP